MRPRIRRAAVAVTAVTTVTAAALAGCTASSSPQQHASTATSSTSTSSAPPSATTSPPARTTSSSHARSTPTRKHHAAPPAAGAPVIVLDPGHSRTISAIDPATGLDVSDYENEPEMRDVFAVALLVRSRLTAAGYRVVMTKTSVDQRRSLGQRAAIARAARAALALSIHDQAGSNGGIGFRAGNNTVYYQSLGTYRATASGHRIFFTNSHIAALSAKYGAVFAAQRRRVEGTSIRLQGSTGYDLGGRGLAGGDIWMVQLLGGVPWIYNESGGNSAGRSGLSDADEQTYADALVASVEHCIPPPR